MNEGLINFRSYQRPVFDSDLGLLALIWRRQAGKSHLLGAIGLSWMLRSVCDVIYVSAAIRLGQENIRKEAAIWREAMAKWKSAGLQLRTNADDDSGRLLDVDAVADLFENQKLETKLYHSQASYSRSIVVAPNPDTAVGWTGNIILDEVGRMPEFRDVWEALEPIVSSQQHFKIRMATTPPPDDSHYSYELLAPEKDGGWPVSKKGNFYTSRAGLTVHRVDAWDGYAAGVPLYDLKTRKALTPEESRARAVDRTAWDRNYGCKFISGGASAISLMALMNAQGLGEEHGCEAVRVTESLQLA